MRSAGRIFMVLAGLAFAAGVTYGLVAKELAGAVMLGVFSVALMYIATTLDHAGPYDRAEMEQDAEPELGPEHMLPGSWWPLVMALGACVAVVGMKFSAVVLALGLVIFLTAAVGWFVQAGRYAADKARHAQDH
ncbi:MAG: cytochrome c oxidase subunit 4 [Actinomycetota bacterium]|nr:cytochrome c oxidase subunit 4 [Actinomycetota bacterium]